MHIYKDNEIKSKAKNLLNIADDYVGGGGGEGNSRLSSRTRW